MIKTYKTYISSSNIKTKIIINKNILKHLLVYLEVLVKAYENNDADFNCCLCTAASLNCNYCVWPLFTGKTCLVEANIFSNIIKSPERTEERIKQLYDWISELKNILNEDNIV